MILHNAPIITNKTYATFGISLSYEGVTPSLQAFGYALALCAISVSVVLTGIIRRSMSDQILRLIVSVNVSFLSSILKFNRRPHVVPQEV